MVLCANLEAPLERIHIACTFGADLYAQSMLISKLSASELSRKFIKSALLVGKHFFFKADLITTSGPYSLIISKGLH